MAMITIDACDCGGAKDEQVLEVTAVMTMVVVAAGQALGVREVSPGQLCRPVCSGQGDPPQRAGVRGCSRAHRGGEAPPG